MSQHSYDVVGLGNAIVDIIASVDDRFLLTHRIAKGGMTLIDEFRAKELLKALADNLDKVKAFTKEGGWIVFHNLTPQGIKDYNKLVGYEHLIRPFRRERVTFPPSRNPLTSGLTTGDIVMYSSEQIFPWQHVSDRRCRRCPRLRR